MILGGGAPKNFLLQTEPQLQEILGVAEKGHDYFIQITDARPDTGGLSGATPAEAVSWGKIDPEKLPDTVVCYVDSTIALPLMATYVQARCKPRKPRRLFKRLPEMVEACGRNIARPSCTPGTGATSRRSVPAKARRQGPRPSDRPPNARASPHYVVGGGHVRRLAVATEHPAALRAHHLGIIWIGHLYFLNLVNVPLQADLDKELKPKVNPKLLLRVFFWFRHGAMATFVFGWLVFLFKYVYQGLLFNPEGGMSNRGAWILFGAILGSIMWFNVWFVIWPRQKQILGGVLKGTPHPQARRWRPPRSRPRASTCTPRARCCSG